ncbi:MAG: UDP-N-acetylglucosamine 2-epimerase (non-hydrolyzing) [Patescibacteria group bacterium]
MNQYKNIKVVTIVGTRPEIIRLSEVIKELDATTNHILVHTGQNYDYDLNEIFFSDLNLRKPDYFLAAAGKTPVQTVAQVLAKVDEVLEREKPDAVLVLGDTNSALALYAAKRRKIPTFHMEAGNRCFDERVPEEINRRIVDHMSDINFVYSERARDYLLRENMPPDRVIKTGSPLFEVLAANKKAIDASSILTTLGLEKGKYFVASFHREENISSDRALDGILEGLSLVAKAHGLPVVISTHPRTKKRMDERKIKAPEQLRFLKPLGFHDYVKLQIEAACVISDSGTISEESSILNLTAVMLREAHERPEASDEATIIMAGVSPERIVQSVALAIRHANPDRPFRLVSDYSMPNVSKKIVRLILGYTDYVRRRVWMQHE